MNRKERRRLEKEAQKQAKQTASTNASGPVAASRDEPKNVSNLLFDHAMNSASAQKEGALTQQLDWELQQISDQLNNGFTGDALKSCQKLDDLYPNNADIQHLSGIAYFMNQDWVRATQCFEAVISQHPNNDQALNYLGDLAIEKNELNQAEDYFRRAGKIIPEDQATLQRLAYVLQRLEKMEEAAKIYRQLIGQDPNSAEIHLNYGYALFKCDQISEAVTEYRAAIKLDPNLSLAYINLGMALSGLDEDEDAINAFRHGLDALPKHVEGLFGLARCLRAQDEYQKAADYFQKALNLAPDRTQVYWELGYSLELAGDKAGGQAAYEKCLNHHPDHSVAQHLLDSLMGNTTETAPQDYIQELFDDYADSFDDNLVNELNYVVPGLLNTELETLKLDQPLRSVLDLGGGTGLVAVEINKHVDSASGVVHGVDLSSGMIDIAVQNNRYHETFVSDIGEFLDDVGQGLSQYELILAGDVFVYIGNLEQIFNGVYQRLGKNGLFLFTVEQSPSENYTLQSTGRFAHSKTYVEELANKSGFEVLSIRKIIPRKDGDTEIDGYLVSLQKR
ncbi:MAG: tetratricopeptide repeat protein [Rhodospirillaceae bacterium]|nr:tetratricopeptide repeat protein [Rhodospirillaceae bacterium]